MKYRLKLVLSTIAIVSLVPILSGVIMIAAISILKR